MIDLITERPYMLVFYIVLFLIYCFCLWKTKSYLVTVLALILYAVWFTFMLLLGSSLAELLLTIIPLLLAILIQTIAKEKKP